MHIKGSNTSKIAQKVTANYDTELEKVRAIFIWITDNIAYDCKKYKATRNKKVKIKAIDSLDYVTKLNEFYSKDVKKTLKQGKGICGDYSMIFVQMCEAVDIEAGFISGYIREDIRKIGRTPKRPEHAWNWVKIDGQIHLLDATWAAGKTDKKFTTFIKSFNEAYFLTPPNAMILNHLPENDQWQLQDTLTSLQEFAYLPICDEGFTKFKVKNYAPNQGLVTAEQDSIHFNITFEKSPKRLVVAEGRKLTGLEFHQQGNTFTFGYEIPANRPRQIVILAYDDNNYMSPVLGYRIMNK
jgi:transglutaminase/protease-like cytokinesis protein 3